MHEPRFKARWIRIVPEFGLQQVYQALRGQPRAPPPFAIRWMCRFDRHPIMTGILVGLWVTPTMTLDHLVFAAGATVYVCVGVHFEERLLRRELGQPYEDYCARVWVDRADLPSSAGIAARSSRRSRLTSSA